MKIPKKFAPLTRAFLMSLILPLFMIFFVTLVNVGLNENFMMIWIKTYIIAAVIAFPLIIIISPRINKFVESITK